MKNATRIRVFLLAWLTVPSLVAAVPCRVGEVAFRQALLDMGTDLRLMCVAAHPDDEDGATLSLYRKRYGVKTSAVIATRGEGGQNEIGPELYDELGVIRTQETMAAASITGAELRFLNLPDFGFSKSAHETFAIWGREETHRRMVRIIRELRPDVIITHHDTITGHGHHQAVGIALLEAFDEAADPSVFSDQIRAGLEPWQASRLYVRRWEETDEWVMVDISALDSWEGKTYAEIAAEALAQHRSQGMDFFIDRDLTGRPKAYYELIKEAPQKESVTYGAPAPPGALFEGLWDRVGILDRAFSQGTPPRNGKGGMGWGTSGAYFLPPTENRPREQLKPQLLKYAMELAGKRGSSPLAHRRWQRANRAATLAAELRLSVNLDDQELIPGQATTATAQCVDSGVTDAQRVAFSIRPAPWFPAKTPEAIEADLSDGQYASAQYELVVPEHLSPTIPPAAYLLDEHFLQPQFDVVAQVRCGATTLELHRPVRIEVAPAVSITPALPRYLVRKGIDKSVNIDLIVTNHSLGGNQEALVLSASPGLRLHEKRVPLSFAAEGEQKVVAILVDLDDGIPPGDHRVTAGAGEPGEATGVAVRVVDVAAPQGISVGVVQSYDNTFLKTLEQLQVTHALLRLEDFTPERLDAFSAIIIDIRAYLVRPDLVANNGALLDYVRRGGNLIVMYQKTREWDARFAPYPIRLSRNRVTQEDAPMHILTPDHGLFTTPNVISPADWEGWIQERGLYFPDQWADQYTPLVACADPGEQLPPGSCLFARYGTGTYLYTALAWYRQLRELHPGALRLFANMIALGKPQSAP